MHICILDCLSLFFFIRFYSIVESENRLLLYECPSFELNLWQDDLFEFNHIVWLLPFFLNVSPPSFLPSFLFFPSVLFSFLPSFFFPPSCPSFVISSSLVISLFLSFLLTLLFLSTLMLWSEFKIALSIDWFKLWKVRAQQEKSNTCYASLNGLQNWEKSRPKCRAQI